MRLIDKLNSIRNLEGTYNVLNEVDRANFLNLIKHYYPERESGREIDSFKETLDEIYNKHIPSGIGF
jgi:hypothetical protein